MTPVGDHVEPGEPSRLLDLPPDLLRCVFSRMPDRSSAEAMLYSCKQLHALVEDPVATAQLLFCSAWTLANFRDRATLAQETVETWFGLPQQPFPFFAAVASAVPPVSQAPRADVVLYLLRMLGTGEQPAHRPALLDAMLQWVCRDGSAQHVPALLALPSPPDLVRDGSRFLVIAVTCGPHVEIVRQLLEGGAARQPNLYFTLTSLGRGPRSPSDSPWSVVTQELEDTPVLTLLLKHCPPDQYCEATHGLLRNAVIQGWVPVVVHLLTEFVRASSIVSWDTEAHYSSLAAHLSDPTILRLVLGMGTPSFTTLYHAASEAIAWGSYQCLACLCTFLADTRSDTVMRGLWFDKLKEAIRRCADDPSQERIDIVRLFIRMGIVVTDVSVVMAHDSLLSAPTADCKAGCENLLLMLVAAWKTQPTGMHRPPSRFARLRATISGILPAGLPLRSALAAAAALSHSALG